jgi:hypothetical protein
MPFDPTKPANNSPNSSAEMRAQLNGLKDLIDAIQGGITSAVVDSVNTVPPGTPASVGVSLSGTELHFTFDLPQGNDGPTGATGQPGEVTLTDLNNATLDTLAQTSNNSNSVGNLSMNADPAYDQNQMQAVMQKLDELINALRR